MALGRVQVYGVRLSTMTPVASLVAERARHPYLSNYGHVTTELSQSPRLMPNVRPRWTIFVCVAVNSR